MKDFHRKKFCSTKADHQKLKTRNWIQFRHFKKKILDFDARTIEIAKDHTFDIKNDSIVVHMHCAHHQQYHLTMSIRKKGYEMTIERSESKIVIVGGEKMRSEFCG